jgi:hypothetical protein
MQDEYALVCIEDLFLHVNYGQKTSTMVKNPEVNLHDSGVRDPGNFFNPPISHASIIIRFMAWHSHEGMIR